MARLPQPGSDTGTWGQILNDYLTQSHNPDGTIKPNAVDSQVLAPGAVHASNLHITGGSDGQVLVKDTSAAGGLTWSSATTGGGVTDHGGLTGLGDDDHPQYFNVSRGDVRYYTKSQVDSSLGGKANASHAHAIADVTNLQSSLDAKASTTHSHAIADVASLQGTLDTKASTSHTHAIANTTGLQAALDAKAATSHTHTAAQISDASATGRSVLTAADAAAARAAIGAGTGSSNLAIGTTATTAKAGNYVPTWAEVTGKPTISGSNTGDQTLSISGSNLTISGGNTVALPAGSTPSWGSITGTLSGQTDLQAALDGKANISHSHAISNVTGLQAALDNKADVSNVVRLTGDQTVDGIKSFSSSPTGPDPTTAQQLATKAYVDSLSGGGGGSFLQNKPWYNVAEAPYNADRTGATDAAPAIQQAIDDANTAGGGVVYIPDGDYLINYNSNVAGLGVAGGLQLYRNIWLKGEGVGSRLIPSGTWLTEAGVVGIGDVATSRGANTIYNVRISDLFIKRGVGPLTSAASIPNTVAVLFNTDNGASVLEPDAAHRVHDLLIWDMDSGIKILGTDDQAMIVQRIRGRRFRSIGVQVGRSDGSGGGPDNYFAFLDFSSAGGTANSAVFEIYAANCHFVSCKAWYAKRRTAFASGATYKDGAGWYIRGTRNTFTSCEAQDNGGHGFLLSYGKNTLVGCIADSNSYYDTVTAPATVNQCSGFYISSGASMTNVDSALSFSRSASHIDQKHGVYIESGVRNIRVTGQMFDNRATTTSTDPNDGIVWSAARDDTHVVNAGSYYSGGSYITIANPVVSGSVDTSLYATKKLTAQENNVIGTTLADDSALVISGIAGGGVRYRIEGFIQYRSDAAQHGKLAVAMTIESGTGTFESMVGWDYLDTSNIAARSTQWSAAPSTVGAINMYGSGTSGVSNIRSVQLSGQIYVGSSVGTGKLAIQLAESLGAGAGTKILTGSWIRLTLIQ